MDFATFMREFGFPTVALVATFYYLAKLAKWVGDHIATPIVVAVVSLIDTLKTSQQEIKETQKEQTAYLQQITVEAKEQTRLISLQGIEGVSGS